MRVFDTCVRCRWGWGWGRSSVQRCVAADSVSIRALVRLRAAHSSDISAPSPTEAHTPHTRVPGIFPFGIITTYFDFDTAGTITD